MLSKKAQYAIQALSYLAERFSKGPVLIEEISRKRKIPIKFLENILLGLKHADIVDSKKGKGGGYFLREAPDEIVIARVIREVDGPIAMLPCVSLYFYQKCTNCRQQGCKINQVFREARDATLSVLEHRTLQDLI